MTTCRSESTRINQRVAQTMDRIRSYVLDRCRSGIFRLALETAPVPASRPRVTRWGTHYAKSYARFRKQAKEELEERSTKPGSDDTQHTSKPLILLAEHIVPRPRTGKRLLPKGDVDNYVKGPLDSLTEAGAFWDDDDQIVLIIASKRYAEPDEEPGVRLEWIELT